MKAYTSRVSKRTRAKKKTASSARAAGVDRRARSTTTSFLIRENRLTERWRWRALAVASADDAALGQTRGIRELAPFFVLLRRLAAVPEYAAAMAPRGARRRARVGGGGGGVAFGAERVRDGAIRRRRREGASSPGVLVPRARRDARLCASEHDSRRHERRERPDPAAPRLAPRRGGGVARARRARGGRADAAVSASGKGKKARNDAKRITAETHFRTLET